MNTLYNKQHGHYCLVLEAMVPNLQKNRVNPLKVFPSCAKVTARFEAIVSQSIVAHEKYFFG